MKDHSITRITSKLLIPYILVFGLYVQFHGDFGPGGGFQAGVIFGAGIILFSLIFGLREAKRVFPPRFAELGTAFGVLLFAGVGIASMYLGANFLDYSVLSHDPVHGQHLGVLLVELGVGITVTCVMVTIFFQFAGREKVSK